MVIDFGEGPESPEEIEMARLQDERLEWRRKMLWAGCPICFHCGYAIGRLSDCRMILNWGGVMGETKIFHAIDCHATALEMMRLRTTSARRPDKYEIAAVLSSWPESSDPILRNLAP